MDIRLHKRVNLASNSITPVPTGILKRSFTIQSDQASVSRQPHQSPNWQTQLDKAARFGHNFSRMQAKADRASAIQPKLTIGQPGDKYEQEADRVADSVMAMPVSASQQQIQRQTNDEEELIQAKSVPGSVLPTEQTQTEEEDEQIQAKSIADSITPNIQLQATEEEQVQMKPVNSTNSLVQLQVIAEEEEEIQTKSIADSTTPLLQRQEATEEEQIQTKPLQQESTASSPEDSHSLESRLTSHKGSGNSMSNEVRAFMQPRFGVDFSQVKIHTGSESVQMNRELNAQAFTHGHDIYFGAGKYNPSSGEGKRLLAHELTHVVQQTGGQRLSAKKETVVNEKKYQNQQIKGKPFVKDNLDSHLVDANDVRQGSLGDCYLLAGMASVARANPQAIQRLIRDRGNGIYDVTIYIDSLGISEQKIGPLSIPVPTVKKAPKVITVNDVFPISSKGKAAFAKEGDLGPQGPELWVMLVEKAYAIHMGGYGKIEGGNPGKAIELITGNGHSDYETSKFSDKQIASMINRALKHRLPVTAYTPDFKNKDKAFKQDAEKLGVVGNHAYSPSDINVSSGTINLQNPWGQAHVNGLSISNFKKFYVKFQIGQ